MRYLIISSHSVLANAMKESAGMIAGKQAVDSIITFHMVEGMEPVEFIENVNQFLKDKKEEDEYLILTDLYGASPTNTSLMAFRYRNYRIVTGLNLGMVLEALYMIQSEQTLDEIADQLVQRGIDGIKKVYLAG
ncbi:MAG: PTS sugar transporter subunit IIA [Floccifex sp.]